MTELTVTEFEFAERTPMDGDLVLNLDGYEGPIDVLLGLAREQKVDLARISILQLADQYLEFISRARDLRLEIAADYLVMAAWLAYLKSRLLLPQPKDEDQPSAAELADALAFRLRRLQAMQEAAGKLMQRPRLGTDVFRRGLPEGITVITNPRYEAVLHDLFRAYGDHRRRRQTATLHIAETELYSMDEALKRLGDMVGGVPDWRTLASFLPQGLRPGLVMRSAMAATFVASLEMTRAGRIQLRQENAFGPIYIRKHPDVP